jgi:UDP-N-acetylglucosamine acyltransferase
MTAIHPTAIVDAGAQLGADVDIGAYSIVGPHVAIGDRTRIMPHVYLAGRTRIGSDCALFPFASIGTQTQDLKYKGAATFVAIGDRTVIREYVTINSGTAEGETTAVGSDCLLMIGCHVAHTCRVGDGVVIANGSLLAGEVTIEQQAVIGGLVGIHQFCRVGTLCMIGGCSKLTQDVPPYMLVDGNPAKVHGINRIGLERRNVSAETQSALKRAYKALYLQNLTTRAALEIIRAEIPPLPEIAHLLEFVATSKRGILK